MADKPNTEAIGLALAKIPSGCFIVTCAVGHASTGMLASWVQQAAFEPPMITVAMKKGRYADALIEQAGCFTVNVIGEEPTAMFRHFGSGFGPDEPAFEGLEITRTGHGVELATAIAHLRCEVAAVQPAGDHRLYLATVVGGGSTAEPRPYVHLRKSGMSY